MPHLRPRPPSDAVRCTKANGHARCKNPRIRGELFCRSHLHLNPQRKIKKTKKQQRKNKIAIKAKSSKVRTTSPRKDIPLKDPPSKNSKVRVPIKTEKAPPTISACPLKEFPPVIVSMLRSLKLVRVPRQGQIWAVPHKSDGLPRAYVRIERFNPRDPMVEVTPLEFHPVFSDEFHCFNNKLPVSCGTFQAQKFTVLKLVSDLCHQIGGEDRLRIKGLKTFYWIYPKKGEIWAIYRDFDGSTSSLFKLVEVVKGFSEEEGVLVVELDGIEVSKGNVRLNKSRSEGSELVRRFSRMQLVVFSHRVPVLEVMAYGESGELS